MKTQPKAAAPAIRPAPNCSALEIAIYAGRLEITERFGAEQVDRLIRRLRALGVDCKLVFKAPCG